MRLYVLILCIWRKYSVSGGNTMKIAKKMSITAAACTILSSAVVGVMSIIYSSAYMGDDLASIMHEECDNTAADINAYLSRVEQSVDTVSDITMNELTDFSSFQTSSEYVTTLTGELEQSLYSTASNTDGADSRESAVQLQVSSADCPQRI